MIRVAFLQASMPVGGAERLVQLLVRALDPKRFETVSVNLYGPGPVGAQLAAAGHAVVSGLAAGRWDPRVGGRLAALLAERQVDLVYVADSALPMFWAGWLRRRRPKPRLVVGFHSTGKPDDWFQHALAGWSARPAADHFVALAPSHEEYLVRRQRLDPLRVTVIANGVDLARFRPAPDRAAAKRAIGFDAAQLLVGIVAALRPEKHHGLFLRMAARVGAELPAVRFLVIGEGPERLHLEELARDLRLGDSLRFLGARDDTPDLYRALDVAVLSSMPVVETFPITLLEALASGTPAVSTRVGSVADIVDDGATGFLVPPGDEARMAAAVGRLLREPALRERMGRAARAEAERRFDATATVAAYERLFERVVRG
jgi:glycosyltransferase involved in cell wall biosynthesis